MRLALCVVCLAGCGRFGFGTEPAPADATFDVVGSDSPPVEESLLLWFPFDGTIANRGAVQSEVSCDPTCPATVAGKRIAAGGFDGATTAVRIADRPELHVTAGTVAMWIRPTTLPTVVGEARSLAGAAQGTASLNAWELYFYQNSGTLELITGGDGGGGPQLHYEWTRGAGAWFHIAATWDGTSMQHLYVDGARVQSGPQFVLDYTGFDVMIGVDDTTSGLDHFFDGAIDDVRMYNRALTQDEIAQLATP